MLIRVSHESVFTFDPPARSLIQVLRMTPRNCEGQHVLSWRIDVDTDCQLVASDDAFGNITHTFSLDETVSSLTLLVEGEVRTFDTAGVVRGSLERFPPELFLRPTALTAPDDMLRSFAEESTKTGHLPLDKLHLLMGAVHERMQAEPAPEESGEDVDSATVALASSRGSSRDVAHLFVTCARVLGIPARYICGYMLPGDGKVRHVEHAWAEAHVAGLGWVAFDAVEKVCPSERHIRVAFGLDALAAASIRSSHPLGGGEKLNRRIQVLDAQGMSQRQS